MLTAKAPKSHSQQVQRGPRALEGHRGATALVLLLLAVAFYWGGGGQDYWPATLPPDEPKNTHFTPNQQAACKAQSPSEISGLSFPG